MGFIAGELGRLSHRRGFAIVGRSELERIRVEREWGMAGEADDDTAAHFAKLSSERSQL